MFVIERTKNLSKIDPTEVVAMLEAFEQWQTRHVEDEDVTDKACGSLSMQPRNSSQASNAKNKKFWKNKEKKEYVKPREKFGAVEKYNGNKENAKKGCKTCGNYTMMNVGLREKFGAVVKYNGNKGNAKKS